MPESLFIGLVLGGIALTILAAVSFALQFFIALKSAPNKRAGWTTGLAYFATAGFLALSGVRDLELFGPLVTIPGALAVFLFWRSQFSGAWYENPESAPDGVEMENDGWRIGLVRVIAAIASVLAILLARGLVRQL